GCRATGYRQDDLLAIGGCNAALQFDAGGKSVRAGLGGAVQGQRAAFDLETRDGQATALAPRPFEGKPAILAEEIAQGRYDQFSDWPFRRNGKMVGATCPFEPRRSAEHALRVGIQSQPEFEILDGART